MEKFCLAVFIFFGFCLDSVVHAKVLSTTPIVQQIVVDREEGAPLMALLLRFGATKNESFEGQTSVAVKALRLSYANDRVKRISFVDQRPKTLKGGIQVIEDVPVNASHISLDDANQILTILKSIGAERMAIPGSDGLFSIEAGQIFCGLLHSEAESRGVSCDIVLGHN
jgi:hypothetical protein